MYTSQHQDASSEEERLPKRRKMSPVRPSLGGRQKATSQNGAAPSGFAAKMMAKMGYVEGQGLGAEGKGRLAPIDAQLRPQGAGLGAVKEKTKQAREEEKRAAAFRGEKLEDSSDEEKQRRRKAKNRQTGVSQVKDIRTPARAKPKYKTVAELETAADGLKVPDALKSIVDATGSETKILNSTAGLMSQTTYVPSETEEVKIAKRAQRDLLSFTDEWISLKHRGEYYDADHLQLLDDIEKDKATCIADETMLDLVRDLQTTTLANTGRSEERVWAELVSRLEPLKTLDGPRETAIEREELAVAAIHPLFKSTMAEWDPLQNPIGVSRYLGELSEIFSFRIRNFETAMVKHGDSLTVDSYRRSTSPYESMLHAYWLPAVRNAIMRDWNVQDSATLIAVIDAWKPVLPTFILANIVDRLVVQRLTESLTLWNPAKARKKGSHALAPHVWLFPWLQYLDDQHTDPRNSTGLMAEVKRKLKSVLSTWSLSQGLITGLDEWKALFGSDLSRMFVRYLLPRFRPHLAAFEVNPGDQDRTMPLLDDVLQWSPYFSHTIIGEFLRTDFFPKWHDSLYNWLITDGVNYDEVGQWYQWWKSVFESAISPDFNSQPRVAAEWKTGLDLMGRALEAAEIGPDATAKLPHPNAGNEASRLKEVEKSEVIEKSREESAPRAYVSAQTSKPGERAATFKDVVEEWCEGNELFFISLGKSDIQTTQPLFRITASATMKGGVIVYLKGDIVWVRKPSSTVGEYRFDPAGLDETLVKRAGG